MISESEQWNSIPFNDVARHIDPGMNDGRMVNCYSSSWILKHFHWFCKVDSDSSKSMTTDRDTLLIILSSLSMSRDKDVNGIFMNRELWSSWNVKATKRHSTHDAKAYLPRGGFALRLLPGRRSNFSDNPSHRLQSWKQPWRESDSCMQQLSRKDNSRYFIASRCLTQKTWNILD